MGAQATEHSFFQQGSCLLYILSTGAQHGIWKFARVQPMCRSNHPLHPLEGVAMAEKYFLAPLTALQSTCKGWRSYTATRRRCDGREAFSTLLTALQSTCRGCGPYTPPGRCCDGRELYSAAFTALQLYNPAGLAGGGEQANSKQQRQRALSALACVFHTVLCQCP